MKGTLVISDHKKLHCLDFNELIRLESKGAYTIVYTKSSGQFVCSRNLKTVAKELNDAMFFRAHKSHVINLREVKLYEKGRGGVLIMSDGSHIDVAQRRKAALLQLLIQA
jgi:two-component system LytT family response regulator